MTGHEAPAKLFVALIRSAATDFAYPAGGVASRPGSMDTSVADAAGDRQRPIADCAQPRGCGETPDYACLPIPMRASTVFSTSCTTL